MTKKTIAAIILFGVVVTACGPTSDTSQAEATPTEVESTEPTPAPTETPMPTDTPEPTATATITDTPVPVTPIITTRGEDILCLYGPDDTYAIGGSFMADEQAEVIGRDETGEWFQIEHPRLERKLCWLAAEQTQVTGDPMAVEVVPPPDDVVFAISVLIDPTVEELNPCNFPARFDVDYTIQGSGKMEFTFRTTSPQGQTGWMTRKLPSGGMKTWSASFEAYSTGIQNFTVEVIDPNGISATGSAEVTCP